MGDTGARRLRRAALAGTLAAAAACGGGGGGDGGAPGAAGGGPVPLVGETDQGMRLRIDVDGERRIRLRMTVDCETAGREDRPGERPNAVPLERHPLEAEVGGDGRFTVDESFVEPDVDDSEDHVDVRVEGAFAPDGTASGTVEVLFRQWDGQGGGFGPDCETGTVAWTAEEPPRPEDRDRVVPVAAELAAADGEGLVVATPAGDVARVTPDGEARRPDGAPLSSPPAPPPPPGGGPTPPTTVIAPGGVWSFTGLAVAGGGVWMADPATGALSRTELAGGDRTATTGVRVESVAAGEGGLWTLWDDEAAATYRLQRRDPATGEVLASTPVTAGRLAAGPSGAWLAHRTDTWRVDRLDPATAEPAESHPVDIESPDDGMVVGADRVWLLAWPGLTALDPATGEAALVDLPTVPTAVAATSDGRGVWTAHPRERVIRRVAAGGNVERTIDVPEGRWQPVATADGAVWLAGGSGDDDRRVVRVDPAATGG